MNEWNWFKANEAWRYEYANGDRKVWIRKFPSPNLGWGGLEDHQAKQPGWYWVGVPNNEVDWKYMPEVTTRNQAKAVALMLHRME